MYAIRLPILAVATACSHEATNVELVAASPDVVCNGAFATVALPGDGRIAIVLDIDYTQPTASGTASDPRVIGGSYSWRLEEQELGIMPAVIYRLTEITPVIPYGGLGPRVLVARSTACGSTPMFSATHEQSTRLGVGLPLGLELPLGPGHALAELLLQYGTIDQVSTGDATTGAVALTFGYRAFL